MRNGLKKEVIKIFDIDKIEEIQSMSQLIAAYEETYNNEEKVSTIYVARVRTLLCDAAIKLGYADIFKTFKETIDSELGDEDAWVREAKKYLAFNRENQVICSSDNFGVAMCFAPDFANLRLNEFTGLPEVSENGKTRLWNDRDDSRARVLFENKFHIHNVTKYTDAFNSYLDSNKYHPIKDKIEALEWDGVDRIELLLHKCLEVEDTAYTREVSRLIFAGGINRLYHPGCKFDDMPVLIGKQGGGKSTFVRWLALEDTFFTELKTIDGKEAMEAINGAWIVEVSELLALTKTREQEAVKAFLSTLKDKYRPAYGRHTVEQPRTCLFIGTSNRKEFIVDKTGGRRFYPVECARVGYDLFRREDEIREYIRMCWAEAYAKLDTPFMATYANEAVKGEIEKVQEGAAEDDYRIGMIETYLEKCVAEGKTRVCFGMIWEHGLENDVKKAERADQTQIGLIMSRIDGWERKDWKTDFGRFGKQRFWKYVGTNRLFDATFTTSNDDIPFDDD